MNVITVYSAKGGVGKTTTSINLAAALTHCGKKVLLIDGDWQGNTTLGMGLNPRDVDRVALADLLIAQIENPEKAEKLVKQCIVYLERENLYLIPTNALMNNEEFRWAIAAPENRYALRDLLSNVDFDFVIIDTPASLDGFLNLAMMASDSVIVPTEMEFLSYDGLENTFNVIETIKENFNPELNIVGVLLNKTGTSNKAKQLREMIIDYTERENIYVFKSEIPRRDAIHDCIPDEETIFAKRSNAKNNYYALANEIIELSKRKKKRGV